MILKRLSLVLALVVLVGLVLPCFAETITYEYDNLYRLTKATYSDGTVIEYLYDAAGNRLSTIKTPPANAPTVSISAAPESIQYGASATLTWSSTNADSCYIDHGIGTVNTSGLTTVSPTATTTYTITAMGGAGTAIASTTVHVTPPPPTVTISANPTSIQYGASSTLTWSSTNAASCTIDQGIGSVDPNGGTVPVSPLVTTAYTITATGLDGSTVTASTTVTVGPPPAPTVTISANPTSIQYGASSTLTWSPTNATSCSIDQGIGSVDPNGGTVPVSPLVTTAYTITATGPGGTAASSATVTVAPPPPQTTILRPDASGDETNISSQQPVGGSHYDKVDEETADDSSSYVNEAGASLQYHRDLYTLEHPTATGTINWIKAWMRIGNTVPTIGGYAKTAIKTGGTVYEGAPIQAPGIWTSYDTQYLTNPNTGLAWTWADISSLQAGVSMRGGGAWLAGWGYRKAVTLSRPAGAVAAYQMKLLVGQSAGISGTDVDLGGHGKTDFSDLRFTAADGTTQLPYWIESVSGSTPNQLATIWIKFDSINTSATTFYMYYGNASAAAFSNGDNTFLFFDDFPGTSLNTTKWKKVNSPTCSVANSIIHISKNASSSLFRSIKSLNAYGPYNVAMRARWNLGVAIDVGYVSMANNDWITVDDMLGLISTSVHLYYQTTNEGHGTQVEEVLTIGYRIDDVLWSNGSVAFYKDGTLKATNTTGIPDEACNFYVGIFDNANTYNVDCDWILLRQYLAPEPTWGTWGAEEQFSGWLSGWGYRKSITLSRPAGAVTAYQMKLLVGQSAGVAGAVVDLGGHGKVDFSDLRFTAADGTTRLPYWIGSVSGSTPNQLATIWIKFNSIDTTDTTFYMYYGNAGATSASNGADTFLFFDDASSNLKSLYTLRNLGNANLNATLSYINSTDGYRIALTAADEVMAEITTTILPANGSYRLRSRTKISSITNGQMGLCARYSTAGVYFGRSIQCQAWPIAGIQLASEPTPPNTAGTQLAFDLYSNFAQTNTWYRQELIADGNTLYYWHELENKSVTATDSSWTIGTWGIYAAYNSGTYVYFKDVTVGKYITPEPTWGTWGAEEGGGLNADCTQVYVEVNYTPLP